MTECKGIYYIQNWFTDEFQTELGKSVSQGEMTNRFVTLALTHAKGSLINHRKRGRTQRIPQYYMDDIVSEFCRRLIEHWTKLDPARDPRAYIRKMAIWSYDQIRRKMYRRAEKSETFRNDCTILGEEFASFAAINTPPVKQRLKKNEFKAKVLLDTYLMISMVQHKQ